MFKNYADINSDIHDDVELTAETVVPAEDGFSFFAEPYGEPHDGSPAVTNIPVMSDVVAALCMLTRALAVLTDADAEERRRLTRRRGVAFARLTHALFDVES